MSLKINLNEFTEFANFLADESGKLVMKYFRNDFSVESKIDNSPVTIADKNTELKLRNLISEKYPEHGILAEEFESKNTSSDYLWVLDPIDGTRSFIAGHKDFGTLIALLYKSNPIIGIIDCPAHNERWLGVKNLNSKLNQKKIQTSQKKLIEDCYIMTSGLYFEDQDFKNNFDKLRKKTKYCKFGGDCYMYGMLASGLIDVVVEDTLKIHDYMALLPVIKGAGGVITDKFGKDISFNSDGSLVASCSQSIHNQVIQILNS